MPENNETRLEWIVTGLKDIQAMSKALLAIAKSNETARKSLGKGLRLNPIKEANKQVALLNKSFFNLEKTSAKAINFTNKKLLELAKTMAVIGVAQTKIGFLTGVTPNVLINLNLYTKGLLSAGTAATVAATKVAAANAEIARTAAATRAKDASFRPKTSGGFATAGFSGQDLGGRARDATGHVSRLNDSVQDVNKSAGLLGLSFKGIVQAAAGFTLHRLFANLTFAIRNSLAEAIEFQQAIGEIRTISQQSQLPFKQWASGVRELSDSFNLPALDVAEGLYQALSNQVAEGAESFQVMTEAVRLAKITSSSTEDAVAALTGSLNSYGLSAGDARFASDLLFKTVELGRTRLKELANSLGSVQILANQLTVTIEETSAAIDVMSIQGITSAKAQTLLRNVLLKMIKPTEELQKIFDQLGTGTGKNTIATFGFVGALEEIRKKARGGGEEMAQLGKIFSRVRAVTGILASDTEQLKEALEEMADAGETANEALVLIQKNAGEKLSSELNKISNIFSLDLGQSAVENLARLSDSIGGLANLVKNLTNATLALVKALVVGLGSAAIFSIGRTIISIKSLSVVIQLATLRAKAFTASLLGQAAIFGAIGFVGALAFDRIRQSIARAKQTVDEFAGALTNDLVAAFAEADAAIATSLADRERTQLKTISITQRKFLQSIAKQTTAINKITALEAQRAILEDNIFAIRLKKTGLLGKEELLFRKMVDLRKQAQKIASAEVLDAEALNDVLAKAESIFALTSQLRNKSGSVSRRDIALQKRRINEIVLGVESTIKIQSRAAQEQLKIDKDRLEQAKGLSKSLIEVEEKTSAAFEKQRDILKIFGPQLSAGLQTLSQISQQFSEKLLPEFTAKSAGKAGATITALPNNIALNKELRTVSDTASSIATRMIQIRQSGKITQEQFVNLVKDISIVQQGIKDSINTAELDFTDAQIAALQTRLQILESAKALIEATAKKDIQIKQTIEANEAVIKEFANFVNASASATIGFFKATDDAQNAAIANIIFNNIQGSDSYRKLATQITAAAVAQRSFNAAAGTVRQNETGRRSLIPRAPGTYFGGNISRFADGGSVGGDTVAARLSPGEFVINKTAAREFFPQLTAINSGAARFNDGGNVTNNNVGDIKVSVQGGDTSEATVRDIGNKLRREINRGVLRLN